MVTAQSILSPSANGFYLSQTALLLTESNRSATLDSWNAKQCLDPKCPYPLLQIRVPSVQAKNASTISISENIVIANMTEFDKYARLALGSEEYSFYLKGSGNLYMGSWPGTVVSYDKKITLKGFCPPISPPNSILTFPITDSSQDLTPSKAQK
jgi:hypothetical protein